MYMAAADRLLGRTSQVWTGSSRQVLIPAMWAGAGAWETAHLELEVALSTLLSLS